MASQSRVFRTIHVLPHDEVAFSFDITFACLFFKTPPQSSQSFCNPHRELQNLRTIIVIADIHQGLHSPAPKPKFWDPPCLTFWHWSGITPYTSSYEFAGSCVLNKQSPGKLSLRPHFTWGRPYPEVTAAFLPSSLRSNHSFALVFST